MKRLIYISILSILIPQSAYSMWARIPRERTTTQASYAQRYLRPQAYFYPRPSVAAATSATQLGQQRSHFHTSKAQQASLLDRFKTFFRTQEEAQAPAVADVMPTEETMPTEPVLTQAPRETIQPVQQTEKKTVPTSIPQHETAQINPADQLVQDIENLTNKHEIIGRWEGEGGRKGKLMYQSFPTFNPNDLEKAKQLIDENMPLLNTPLTSNNIIIPFIDSLPTHLTQNPEIKQITITEKILDLFFNGDGKDYLNWKFLVNEAGRVPRLIELADYIADKGGTISEARKALYKEAYEKFIMPAYKNAYETNNYSVMGRTLKTQTKVNTKESMDKLFEKLDAMILKYMPEFEPQLKIAQKKRKNIQYSHSKEAKNLENMTPNQAEALLRSRFGQRKNEALSKLIDSCKAYLDNHGFRAPFEKQDPRSDWEPLSRACDILNQSAIQKKQKTRAKE